MHIINVPYEVDGKLSAERCRAVWRKYFGHLTLSEAIAKYCPDQDSEPVVKAVSMLSGATVGTGMYFIDEDVHAVIALLNKSPAPGGEVRSTELQTMAVLI